MRFRLVKPVWKIHNGNENAVFEELRAHQTLGHELVKHARTRALQRRLRSVRDRRVRHIIQPEPSRRSLSDGRRLV